MIYIITHLYVVKTLEALKVWNNFETFFEFLKF
jgi:hypothetical protein